MKHHLSMTFLLVAISLIPQFVFSADVCQEDETARLERLTAPRVMDRIPFFDNQRPQTYPEVKFALPYLRYRCDEAKKYAASRVSRERINTVKAALQEFQEIDEGWRKGDIRQDPWIDQTNKLIKTISKLVPLLPSAPPKKDE